MSGRCSRMNEVKRQLDQKMGHTKARSEKIMQMVEQNKKTQRKKSPKLYYVAFATFAALLAVLLYMNPFETQAPTTSTPTPNESSEQTSLNLKNLFKQDGDVAYFVGMNNEYATFKETTTWLSDNYVKISVDNGAIETRKFYRITADAIYLVFEDMPEMQGNKVITLEYLDTLTPISTLLVADIENTTTINENNVTYPAELNIPLKKFNNVIEITNETENATMSFYYAEHFGLIGQISTFTDGLQIISLLTSINTEPAIELTLPVMNQATHEKEILTFEERIMFDPLSMYHPKFTDTTAIYTTLHQSEEHELGIIEINLPQQFTNLIVVRTGDLVKTISGDFREIVDWKLSPDQKHIAIYSSDGHDWQSEEYYQSDNLEIYHLEQLLEVKTYTDEELNLLHSTILSYHWVDHDTLEYVVPDVEEPSYPKLFVDWMHADNQPTKTLQIKFE